MPEWRSKKECTQLLAQSPLYSFGHFAQKILFRPLQTPHKKLHALTTYLKVQWKLDLADTDVAENLDLKDTHQKIFATIFDI